MANLNKDAIKKHHFWILVGLAPLLVLIAIVMLTSSVGAEIAKLNGEIEKTKTELKSKSNPKSKALLEKFEVQVKDLSGKRTELWKDNWDRQIGLAPKSADKTVPVQDPARNLLRWPKSPRLAKYNYTANYATDKRQLKFGDPLLAPNETDEGEFNEFTKREIYLAEFANAEKTGMADRIAPTQFSNGWTAVLRHVKFPDVGPNGWGEFKPTSEQIWLALEDIWIQRAMLDAVKVVDDQMAAFAPTPRPEDAPLDRAFTSRIWGVTLKVTQRTDGRFVITGTLRNATDRLQLLGVGNTLTLNVWLTNDRTAPPFAFKIGGEFVPGGATVPIVQTDDHVLPQGTIPVAITKVEQVFDVRTVPIRRVDRLALGFKDSRYAAATLMMPKFKKFEDEEKAAGASASTSTVGPEGGGSSLGTPPGLGTNKPAGGASGQTSQLEGGGDVASVIDGNKKRYLDPVTPQVRRMPVAIALVVDQAYMQDVLLAYANSPMRFQITQVEWKRFRGALGSGTSGGGSSAGGSEEVGVASGNSGKFGMGPGAGSLGPAPEPLGPMGPMGGSSGGPPRPGPGAPGPLGFGGGGSLQTISEGQLTSGLIELTVYGVVSIYEKYTDAPPAAP